MSRHCAIISGGHFSPLTDIETADYIIACDKGYQYAKDSGIKPNLLVGDFDSYSGSLPDDIPRLDLPVEKDDTDTLAAIRWAVDEGFSQLTLYCALGGRLDHLLANIQCGAFAAERGVRLRIIDEACEMIFLSFGTTVLPKREGFALSLFSVSDVCHGVALHGTKYSLRDATLTNRFPIGVSNEWLDDAKISVEEGILLIMQAKMSD